MTLRYCNKPIGHISDRGIRAIGLYRCQFEDGQQGYAAIVRAGLAALTLRTYDDDGQERDYPVDVMIEQDRRIPYDRQKAMSLLSSLQQADWSSVSSVFYVDWSDA